MKKLLLALVLFFVGLVLFMPKLNLLYTLESFLQKEHIQINAKESRDRWVDLLLQDVHIGYDGIDSLKIERASIKPWIFYNRIELTGVKPSASVSDMVKTSAKEFHVTHSILHYNVATVEGEGAFGVLEGEIDLKDRKVHLILHPSKSFRHNQILRENFRKTKEGYLYESHF